LAKIKIGHYVVRKGKHGYWLPTPKMQAAGFQLISCGHDGPAAWTVAKAWEDRWQAYRHGQDPEVVRRRRYPADSAGDAFERYRRTDSWKAKAPRTREDWERGWKYIEPFFGDLPPTAATFELLDRWYHKMLAKHGVGEAFRAMKTWRSLYVIMAGMRLCPAGQDPSLAIRRETPKGRNQVWTAGEAVRLVKGAWRAGYKGLACIVAVAWDTGFSPGDVRELTPSDAFEAGDDWGFLIGRGKTGVEQIGTLTARTRRLVLTYLDQLGVSVLPDAPLFRSRGHKPGPKGGRPRPGVPYTKDALVDDFADLRRLVFGADETRKLMDMRRSGAREANAGEVAMTSLAAKMGNSIDTSKALQRTYMPTNLAAVRSADEARRKGRRLLGEERNQHKKLKLGGEKS
jgi:integrase